MVEPKYSRIAFAFGVKGIDRTGVDQWNTSFIGKAEMDKDFNMRTTRVQNSLKGFCRELKKQSFVVPTTLDCWIDKFDDWLRQQENKKIPLEEDEFMTYLNKWRNKDEDIGHSDGRRAKDGKQIGIVDG